MLPAREALALADPDVIVIEQVRQYTDVSITGDTLFIGTTLMPGSSRRQLIESIRSRLMTLPDGTIVYPGHGRETTIGDERRDNRYTKDYY